MTRFSLVDLEMLCCMQLQHILLVQGVCGNSGSSGHSSMEASRSPSVSNSGDLLRQSSTVSGEGRHGTNALHVLKAAAARAGKWRAATVQHHAGWQNMSFPRQAARLMLHILEPGCCSTISYC